MKSQSGEVLEALVRRVARRPGLVLAIVGLLALAGAIGALSLRPSAGTDTLVSRGSSEFKATDTQRQRFGDDAVVVLIREDLPDLLLTADLGKLLGLEGCLGGHVPAGVTPPGGTDGPCGKLSRTQPIQVVYGPATFINEAATQLGQQFQAQTAASQKRADQAAEAARKLAAAQGKTKAEQDAFAKQARDLVNAQYVRDTLKLAFQYRLSDIPRLDDPNFVSTLVFDPSRPRDRRGCEPASQPKARFAYLFPSCHAGLVQARLKPGLSDAQREQAISLVRQAAAMPEFKLRRGHYVVSGVPVVVNDLAAKITSGIIWLLLAAIAVMALVLAAVFRTSLRLVPLGVALAAAALTFGGMALLGIRLTMASIAVLPVLIGLAVDYAIQFQSRYDEERADGTVEAGEAAARAARRGGPVILTALLATAAGFLVLLLSPVPMVRAFGVLLVAGIAIAYLTALTGGAAALVLAARSAAAPGPFARRVGPALRGAGELVGSAARRVRDLAVATPLARPTRAFTAAVRRTADGAVSTALARPGRVLAVGLAVAAVGWGVETQTKVVSDVTQLVPQSLQALRDVRELQDATGVSGEIDVMVEAKDLTDPAIVSWMSGYQQRLLKRYGYSSTRGCGTATLCPALSLPDLFRTGTSTSSKAQIRALLDAVPPYFSQAVITADRRTATLAFGIRLMSLERQHDVIEEMRSDLKPPPGVRATLVGLPVLAADANAKLSSSWRRLLTLLVGLAAVALVLSVALRGWRRALVPLVPIALATGWSALVLFALRIPLNPMSATLGALVIAISTEFAVLLAERHREERAAGGDLPTALRRAYASTGTAVLASGTTAIAGFGVLVASDIRMLRDFGLVTVIDLAVSLAGVLVVLPAALALAERGGLRPSLARLRPRLPRPGRASAG